MRQIARALITSNEIIYNGYVKASLKKQIAEEMVRSNICSDPQIFFVYMFRGSFTEFKLYMFGDYPYIIHYSYNKTDATFSVYASFSEEYIEKFKDCTVDL